MTITIPTDKVKFFRQGIEILKHIPPLNKLTSRELDVLGYLLYYDYEYRTIEESLRGKLVFDYENRVKIRDFIGITEAGFNNLIKTLKTKGIIKGKQIIPKIKLDPENPEIIFKFKFDEEVKDW